jgi:hypothetical protein
MIPKIKNVEIEKKHVIMENSGIAGVISLIIILSVLGLILKKR